MQGDASKNDQLEVLKRRVAFEVTRRSMFEAELLFQRFLDAELNKLDETLCEAFLNLLVYPDADLLDWMAGIKEPPAEVDRDLLERVNRHWPSKRGASS
ncbi:succinate dehydrogenase assembly factor 2 [Magnetococcus sp. PR-3]|uniref:succinate dehydrogenase assembly factor 2 n=1 Tax=Magnetococcus sp. PR-3 TaxID=3120355 RepID=UPI002FCE2ACC